MTKTLFRTTPFKIFVWSHPFSDQSFVLLIWTSRSFKERKRFGLYMFYSFGSAGRIYLGLSTGPERVVDTCISGWWRLGQRLLDETKQMIRCLCLINQVWVSPSQPEKSRSQDQHFRAQNKRVSHRMSSVPLCARGRESQKLVLTWSLWSTVYGH